MKFGGPQKGGGPDPQDATPPGSAPAACYLRQPPYIFLTGALSLKECSLWLTHFTPLAPILLGPPRPPSPIRLLCPLDLLLPLPGPRPANNHQQGLRPSSATPLMKVVGFGQLSGRPSPTVSHPQNKLNFTQSFHVSFGPKYSCQMTDSFNYSLFPLGHIANFKLIFSI